MEGETEAVGDSNLGPEEDIEEGGVVPSFVEVVAGGVARKVASKYVSVAVIIVKCRKGVRHWQRSDDFGSFACLLMMTSKGSLSVDVYRLFNSAKEMGVILFSLMWWFLAWGGMPLGFW